MNPSDQSDRAVPSAPSPSPECGHPGRSGPVPSAPSAFSAAIPSPSVPPREIDLPFDPPPPGPDANVEHLVTLLLERHHWLTAGEILNLVHWPETESNRRKLRLLAAASDGRIISGQHGYRHLAHASMDEINHAANWLQHQAKEMSDRATAIRRRAHTLLK